ncbi:retrovirus-related pol polyprotein from transposon TNT 1-94 [Tanacetum coccineum]|uniref:Retrovirus-related pol polyprotein from transposon TNT 1-94 n=1 Tax=Tanacetum coccineum TaxID=301880 RepID=A0ABQ5B3N0_9ASTR
MYDQGLHKEITDMKEVFTQMETKVVKCFVERKTFEIKEKELLLENECLLELLISQDLVHNAVNSLAEIIDYQIMEKIFLDEYSECVELKAELWKKNKMVEKVVYDELSKRCARMENKCISLEIKENADTLHEIVEHARALRPLDSDLDSACKFTTRVQELLVYVRDIRPSSSRKSEKLIAVTPINKVKKVRFAEPSTSSSNTHKQVDSCKIKDSNKPLLPSTGVLSSTSASGSKPQGNTKKNRISRPTSSNKKNKVEDHIRSIVIKLLKKIQVRLNATVHNIRTDNGTEFVNQTLQAYYDDVGISHQTSVACTPQQNDVVKRRNHTLVEAAQPSSQESSSIVQLNNPPFKHISKWTKIHPLRNVIENPSGHVSTRKLLQTDAMWCFFDAFLTSFEQKNFKEELLESYWIDAMQEEIYEFAGLDVWELVPCQEL